MARPGSLHRIRRDRNIGWVFVATQALLLVVLIAIPGGTLWAVSGWMNAIALLLIGGGVGLGAWAILSFGAGVTPSPVPATNATLVTSGPFGWIRHPMYTGVMAAAVGITLRTASWAALALLGTIVVFFGVKARWEEHRLVDAYAGYPEYRANTGRFLPRSGALRRSPT